MSRVRLGGLAVTAAVLIAGAWALAARAQPGPPPSPDVPAAADAALGAPSLAPHPSSAGAAGAAAPHTVAGANRAKEPTKRPAPFVQKFAGQPGVKPLPPRRSPTTAVHVDIAVDGCDHNYGTRTQCIPWSFPDGVTDKCAWLEQHGYRKLAVTGTDRQHLDRNGNHVACDG